MRRFIAVASVFINAMMSIAVIDIRIRAWRLIVKRLAAILVSNAAKQTTGRVQPIKVAVAWLGQRRFFCDRQIFATVSAFTIVMNAVVILIAIVLIEEIVLVGIARLPPRLAVSVPIAVAASDIAIW
jgi:hypothetical protein